MNGLTALCIVWRTVDKCHKRHFPLCEPHAHYYIRNLGRNGCEQQAVSTCCVRITVQRPFMKNKWTQNNLRALQMHAKWKRIRWFGQGKWAPINSHSLNGLIIMFPLIMHCTWCTGTCDGNIRNECVIVDDAQAHAYTFDALLCEWEESIVL